MDPVPLGVQTQLLLGMLSPLPRNPCGLPSLGRRLKVAFDSHTLHKAGSSAESKHLLQPQPGGRGLELPAALGRTPGEGRAARPDGEESPQPIGTVPVLLAACLREQALSAVRLAVLPGAGWPARSSASARLYGQPRRWG